MTIQSVLGLLLLIMQTLAMAESIVEVVPVYNRPASEIEPLLAPLLEGGDHIVPNGDTMIVKTTTERLETITSLIRKLDNPLTNLQISVIQSRDTTAQQLNAGIGFDIDVSPQDFGNVSGRADGYYHQNQGRYNNQTNQTIRTTDGATAYIKAGNVVPITHYQVYQDGYGYPYQNQSTQLVEATTGFAVTPRLVGQQVMLEVSPWSDRYRGQGQFQTEGVDTTLRVNLGEWVDLGGVNESGQNSGNGTFSYRQESLQNNLHILVKVDVVN